MQYRTVKNGGMVSILGYGCMRFTKNNGVIDIDKAEKEVMEAVAQGVNYLDTAYIYPGSEAAVGEILRRNNCRDRIFLATKLPQYLVRTRRALDRYFDEELQRLGTDHIDFYLMHMLSDLKSWEKLKKLGVEEWIAEKKHSGQIRNIGFSFHGDTQTFLSVLNAYDWDFCQIQYNYMDEHSQAGRKGLEEAAARGIPVIVMEPLRGGHLASKLPQKVEQVLKKDGDGRSAAEWSLRWLWDQPGVTCVLSGMNSMDMVEENCRIAGTAAAGAFTETDFSVIDRLRRAFAAAQRVGCTGCGYCQPCPQGVNIPGIFQCCNEISTEGLKRARHEYLQTNAMRRPSGGASRCVGCGKCEGHCPQKLSIREELKKAEKEMETPVYKIVEAAYQHLKI